MSIELSQRVLQSFVTLTESRNGQLPNRTEVRDDGTLLCSYFNEPGIAGPNSTLDTVIELDGTLAVSFVPQRLVEHIQIKSVITREGASFSFADLSHLVA